LGSPRLGHARWRAAFLPWWWWVSPRFWLLFPPVPCAGSGF